MIKNKKIVDKKVSVSNIRDNFKITDKYKKVKCEICKKKMFKITNTHLWKVHQITVDEYKNIFPNAEIEDKQLAVDGENKVKELKQKRVEDVIAFYGDECQRCGTNDNLVVHHIDFNIENNDLKNLLVLCRKCHGKIHNIIKPGNFVGISLIEKGAIYMLKGLEKEFGLDLKDVNLIDTPKRVARAYYEIFKGINSEEEIKEILSSRFPSIYDGMVIVGPIRCYSMCPHHLLPIIYTIHLGYIPNNSSLGLSKIARLVKLIAKAPMLQEDFTKKIVNILQDTLKPKGCMTIVEGDHMCMKIRGIEQENSITITSSVSGNFNDLDVRSEFLNLIKSKR